MHEKSFWRIACDIATLSEGSACEALAIKEGEPMLFAIQSFRMS